MMFLKLVGVRVWTLNVPQRGHVEDVVPKVVLLGSGGTSERWILAGGS
jgi:hypothetical protein